MANNSTNTNDSVCSVFDTYPYVIVAAVSSGSAMVSALCCIFVIGLVFLLKKKHFFTQRLILYHCLATLFRSFSTILRLHLLGYQNETSAINGLCIFSGFTNQLTNWFLIMDYSVITFTLLMTAVFHKNVAHLEGLYVVLIFIFPLTFNWIPFINNAYGRAGAWCWIRNLNYDNCTEFRFGIILRNSLQSVPQYILLVALFSTYIFIITYLVYQWCRKRGGNIDNQGIERMKRHLREEVWPLLLFPFGVMLLNTFSFINRIYVFVNIDNPSYVLWILSALFSPLQGGYIAVVYTLDRDTLKRLTFSNLVAIFCKRKNKVHEYPMERSWISDSVACSTEGKEISYKRFRDSDPR